MSHKKYDCNHPIITFTKLIFSFSKKILYLRIRHIRMARKQQYRLPERAGMHSVVISSMKFDNKSIWNNPKISVPKMCKIVVSWSLKDLGIRNPKTPKTEIIPFPISKNEVLWG